MDEKLKEIDIDIELAARLRMLTDREWQFVKEAVHLSYDSLSERGITPTIGKIAQMIYEILIAEKQRRKAIGQN